MKKILITVVMLSLVLTLPFAEDAKKPKVQAKTKIGITLAYPMAAMLSIKETVKIPVLAYDHALLRNNNVTFNFGVDLTPITLEGMAEVVWTPVAFFEMYSGISFGSGWSIPKMKLNGLVTNAPNALYKKTLTPIKFSKAYTTFNTGLALQFDTGAFFENPWSHVIARIDQGLTYRGVVGLKQDVSWGWQNDKIAAQRNGWHYVGSYFIGYQMPIALQTIGFLVETEKDLHSTPANRATWGEDQTKVIFGPVINFVLAKWCTLTFVGQGETKHRYNEDETIFYQYKSLESSKPQVVFKRIAAILTFTIDN